MIDTKLDNYVVIDIENPNTKADSICSIAFIEVKNNEVVVKENLLINPEDRFDHINMRVNGITPNMVKDAITFPEFWDKYKTVFEDSIIIGHGVRYDLSVIFKSLERYNIPFPNLKYICTQKLAKEYLDVNEYKLDKICKFLNINLEHHHNSIDDAEACLEIFKYINDNYDLSSNNIEKYIFQNTSNFSHSVKITYSDDTKSLQTLKGIIENIMEDKIIDKEEINELNEWLKDNIHLKGNYPYDKIYKIVNDVLEDGIISQNEYNELQSVFNEFICPIQNNSESKKIKFENSIFCLTGTFNSGSKEDIENKIVQMGGICSKGVTSKTNYLIVGGAGSDAWKFGNYGGKVQKAMELKEKGKNIQIIGEEDFLISL